jgi:hypothetical protein
VPKNQWPHDGSFEEHIAPNWDAVWGDRRQSLVFIGIGMDEAVIRARLDACLVPDDKFAPENWDTLADPFPSWGPSTHALETAL